MEKKKHTRKIEGREKELEKALSDMENKWKRALADYQNLEKRTVEQKIEFMEFANSKVMLDFLDVLDSLEDAASHINDEGLSLSVKKFRNTLSNNGVSEIKAENSKFDSALMEAVDARKGEENKVLEVVKKGYMLNNKVLRPAQVVVGRKE